MLQVYLPIAEISVNLMVMLGLGAAVGFLSGMFGVGGGFLLTPLLMFSGIPPAIAVATGEVCHNRVIFKQLLQADAIRYVQVDSCRMGGVNEVIAVVLMAAKFGADPERLAAVHQSLIEQASGAGDDASNATACPLTA